MLLNQYRNHSKSTRLLYNKGGGSDNPPYPFTPKKEKMVKDSTRWRTIWSWL